MFEPMMTLKAIALPLGGRLLGADAAFSAVSTDSRKIEPGQLFIALTGPNFDGHDYLNDVAAKGAVAALVEHAVPEVNLPQLWVANTRLALGQLGALNRQAFAGPVVAVTGSSGKTTVKEMLASILREALNGEVLATRGNLNNDLGVPLTLLELRAGHVAAVIELGANHVGEIAYTAALAKPQVVILNNAGNAHVGEFGGLDRVVEAKGEIIDSVAANGIVVLNLDDRAFEIWRLRAGNKQILSFSLLNPLADFYASGLQRDARGCPWFNLQGLAGEARIQLNLLGEHNVANALAASAAACALGVPLAGIRCGLERLRLVKGRAEVRLSAGGARIIDDTYNANPAAICAAVDTLAAFSGRSVLVLGDIGELGEWAEQGHRDVGAYAAGKVDALYAVGPLMRHAVAAFGAGGRHFVDQASLIDALGAELGPSTTLLVKGSRSAAMDKVVTALCASAEETH